MAIEGCDLLIDDALYFREELFVGMEPVAHGDGEGNNKLAVRNDRKDVIDEVSRGFSHSSTTATGAEASFFAGEGENHFLAAAVALKSEEAIGGDTAFKIVFELGDNILGQGTAFVLSFRDEAVEFVVDDLIAGCGRWMSWGVSGWLLARW